jgi:serine/threonine protein kinase/tetratricopeptide (TPR) repeat protein
MRDNRLDSLLLAWQEQQLQGRDPPAAELCRDCPELADELNRRIAVLRRMNELVPPAKAASRPMPAEPLASVTTIRQTGTAGNGKAQSVGRPGANPAEATAMSAAVPGYEILGELGRGGMGVVYKARHLKLNRIVALKMILARGYAGPGDRARFLAEAEVVAAVQHPHLVALLEYGEHQGQPFFTLEFLPGGSLAEKLQGIPQPAAAAVRLVEQLARGIHHAHTHGIVHRDLKPANVLFAEDGTPKITDFGLARRQAEGTGLTATGEVLGTPSYMAPEQAGGESKHAGPAADVYALGAILYECLTGRPPFRAATPVETVLQVVGQEPVSVRRLQPHTPADLATICHKCLQKEPHKRYASAAELADDVRRFLEDRPIRARRPSVVQRLRKWSRRHTGLMWAGVVLFTMATIASSSAAVLIWQEQKQTRAQKERAEEAERQAQAISNFLQQDLLLQIDFHQPTGGRLMADPNLTVKEALHRAAARVRERFHDRPVVEAAIRQTIGRVYRSVGENRLAVVHLERAVELRQTHLGPDHPDTLDSLETLATVYQFAGRLPDAIRLFELVLARRRATLGPDHEMTLITTNTLGEACRKAGQLDRALALIQDALAKKQATLGPDDVSTVNSIHDLGLVWRDLGQCEKAIGLLEKATQKLAVLEGPDHPDTLYSIANLSEAYRKAGRLDQADRWLRAAIAGIEKGAVHRPLDVARLRARLGENLRQQKKPAEAESALRASLAALEKVGTDDRMLLHVRTLLAEALLDQRKYGAAEPLLLQAFEQVRRRTGLVPDGEARLRAVMERLVRLYETANQPEKARTWGEKLTGGKASGS